MNWWLLESDFQPTARRSWQTSNTQTYHAKSKKLTQDLKIWRKKKRKPLNHQLEAIENQLQQEQNKPPHEQNHNRQAELAHNHQTLLTKDAEYHRQRFKKTWATKGDRNTKFFQQAILKRARKNIIMFLHKDDGTTVITPQDIAGTFMGYFQQILTSQLQPQSH